MTLRKPKSPLPIFRGDTKNASHKLDKKGMIALNRDPRQEFWDYLPLKKHMVEGFASLPYVGEYLASGKRLPKYAFEKDGSRVFLFYTS
jgi:hypothetical protein